MDDSNQDIVSPEEATLEAEITKEVNDDELRAKLADDLGLDPEIDADILDKVVNREKSHHERLSGAIKQKISWREKFKQITSKPKENPSEGNTHNNGTPDFDELFEKKFNERMEKQELASLDLPDEIKQKVQTLAQLNGVSIKEAAQDPLIVYMKEEHDRNERIKSASPKRSGKGSYVPASVDPSKALDPEDYDLSTEEGRKAWKAAKAAREDYLASNR